LNFWATVYKTVRPMLSVRCPVLSVLSVYLSVTFVHCGETVRWIKVKLGHIVLDEASAPPPPKGHSSHNFRLITVAAKWLHGSRCNLIWN